MASTPGIAAMPPGRPMASPETLVGASQQSGSDSQANRDKSQALMGNVKQVHGDLDALAMQHPEMAEAANQAKKILTDAMMGAIAGSGDSPTRGIQPPG